MASLRWFKAVFVWGLFVLLPSAALAQQERKVGLTAGYPATVGVLWQVAERFAIRPDVSWSRATTESSTVIDFGSDLVFGGGSGRVTVFETSTKSHSFTVGLSGLWTLKRHESLRLYVGGRAGYSRSSSTSTTTRPSISTTTNPSIVVTSIIGGSPVTTPRDASEGYSGSGFFGGQYGLGNRFAVFGEVGGGYTKTDLGDDFQARSAGLRSGVGVILFF